MSLRPLAAVDPDAARRRAEEILSEDRFSASSYPRPLQGIFRWIGDRLEPLTEPVGRAVRSLVEAIDGWLPGGEFVGWVLLAVALLLAALAFGARLATRRAGALERSAWMPASPRDDPAALESAAREAERGGDLERAIRLRFRAGLIRLASTGAITLRPSLTSGQVRRTLRSKTFDDVSWSFDAVVYGGRKPTRADVELSRLGWTAVLREAER